MKNEVLLYGLIWAQSSADFIKAINEIEDGHLTIRVNSPGGEVGYGYGMIAKFKEFEGDKTVKIDGMAHSMAAYFAIYADDVESIDTAKMTIHRAAYASWFESSMDESSRKYLEGINKDLERAFRNKVDVAKFEEITGKKVKEIFSMDDRLDVTISAQEAKKVGIINKIVSITPKKQKKIQSRIETIAAKYGQEMVQLPATITPAATKEKSPENNNSIMNKAELKEKFPSLYAEIFNEGKEEGKTEAVKAERDRVGAWNAFAKVDPEAVKKGIESGEAISETARSEFAVKMQSPEYLKKLEADTTANGGSKTVTKTPEGEPELTPEQKLEAEIKDAAGLPKEEKQTPAE